MAELALERVREGGEREGGRREEEEGEGRGGRFARLGVPVRCGPPSAVREGGRIMDGMAASDRTEG